MYEFQKYNKIKAKAEIAGWHW